MRWLAALAVLFIAGLGPSQVAAEPKISVLDSGMAAQYRDVIDSLVSEIDADAALAAKSTHDTPALYFDLNGPLDQGADFTSLTAGDQALLRAAKKTYDLYRSMGGELLDRFAMVQRRNNRYYIAVDGEGGRWVVTVEEALAFLLEELVTAENIQLAAASAGSNCPYNFHCLLLATYLGMIQSIAYVPRDTTVTIEITGDGLGGDENPPVLHVPDGMILHDLIRLTGDKFVAKVAVSSSAPLGMNIFRIYLEGHEFRSLAELGVEVMANPSELEALSSGSSPGTSSSDQAQALPGSGEFQPLIDDHSATSGSASLLSGAASGRLGSPTDADLFKIVVDKAGVLSVASTGPTDVRGTLETDEGSVIATDDDGGARYNFLLEQPVTPGTYFLRVTHCCAGLGDYRITSSLSPN